MDYNAQNQKRDKNEAEFFQACSFHKEFISGGL